MTSHALLTAGAFGAALLVTLVLAAYLTPRAWWRRANARALSVLAAGTFGLGTALLWLAEPATNARAAVPVPAASLDRGPASIARTYRAYDDLNLRDGTGVFARRVAVLPSGSRVTPTGARRGDWWQVSARVDGREVGGWVSSLWLRRDDEPR
jgi:uncharacterized protein YgiM (DUF1202 family)